MEGGRKWPTRWPLGLSIVLVIGFLLLVSLVISTALAAFSDYLDWILPGLATILHIVHLTLSFGFTTVLFAMIFKILPATLAPSATKRLTVASPIPMPRPTPLQPCRRSYPSSPLFTALINAKPHYASSSD